MEQTFHPQQCIIEFKVSSYPPFWLVSFIICYFFPLLVLFSLLFVWNTRWHFFSSCYDYAEVNWINDVTHKRENEFNISFDVARTMDTQGLLLVCLDVGSQSAVVSKRIAALARPANVNPIFHLDRLCLRVNRDNWTVEWITIGAVIKWSSEWLIAPSTTSLGEQKPKRTKKKKII